MKKLLLSTLIFFGLFGVSINSVNAEALTDAQRLQMLQKHAGDIAFVDGTTLEDVVWLTKSLSKSDLKWIAEYLKKQTNQSEVDVLKALVGAQDPDRTMRFYTPTLRRIKNIRHAPRKLAELSFDTIHAFLETDAGHRYLTFCSESKCGMVVSCATQLPVAILCFATLYYTNSSYLKDRNKIGYCNEQYAFTQKSIRMIEQGIRTGIITGATLVLTGKWLLDSAGVEQPIVVLTLAGPILASILTLYYTSSPCAFDLSMMPQDMWDEVHQDLRAAAKKCTQVTTVGTALLLTAIVAKNVLAKG